MAAQLIKGNSQETRKTSKKRTNMLRFMFIAHRLCVRYIIAMLSLASCMSTHNHFLYFEGFVKGQPPKLPTKTHKKRSLPGLITNSWWKLSGMSNGLFRARFLICEWTKDIRLKTCNELSNFTKIFNTSFLDRNPVGVLSSALMMLFNSRNWNKKR